MYTYTYTYMYMYMSVYVYMHMQMCPCIYVHVHIYVCLYANVCVQAAQESHHRSCNNDRKSRYQEQSVIMMQQYS